MTPLRFFLERWIQKGILYQLLLMASLVVLVATGGGLVAWLATSTFAAPGEAIWWAFLRLTDPGYLGDDEGVILRVVSTVVTILGYVIFMGSLIAIMTQWLSGTLRKLESGLTPISMKEHVVILGWTNRTPEIVLRLLDARGRLERFLTRRQARKLRVVILAEKVDSELRRDLRDYLGAQWNESQVFLRSGSSLQPDDLARLDLKRASAVLVPGADFATGDSGFADARVIRTLLTVNRILRSGELESRPYVVAEISDTQKVPLMRAAVDRRFEIIASNHVAGRLLSQSVRHPGLGPILLDLLSHGRLNSIYVRGFPQLEGMVPQELFEAFPQAIVLGHVPHDGENFTTDLDPTTAVKLKRDDLIVFLAKSFDDCVPSSARPQPSAVEVGERLAVEGMEAGRRILALGWSYKLGPLAAELDESGVGAIELTIMSRVPALERERWLERVGPLERVKIHHVEGDYSVESDLDQLDLKLYDNIVFLASDYMSSPEEADARTILGHVLLQSKLKGDPRPEILVELLDPDNSHLFEGSPDVCFVTPRVLSHVLAHITLRPELNSVFDELFGAGGSEIELRSPVEFPISGASFTFTEIQRACLSRNVIALGMISGPNEIELNPDRGRRWTLDESDRLIVLSRLA